jgi:hypothetical protein
VEHILTGEAISAGCKRRVVGREPSSLYASFNDPVALALQLVVSE